ncbi:MAG: redoxin family protein [Mariniblastus sp.]|nr:redoxin family protein [Mariniblastus sp.]
MKSFRTTTLLMGLALLAHSLSATETTVTDDLMTVGSKAPALDIEHWLSDGNGTFHKVRGFEPDKIYVIEFWATWCGPCIASIPHLSELQKKYADKNVQIISVSQEDLTTVEGFLANKVTGKAETYGQLTSNYCLTSDPDGSVQNAYMKASQQNGIPTAFIVGKDGRIDWIGHPIEMDQPLQSIVDDRWDREQFATDFKLKQEIEQGLQRAMKFVEQGKFKDGLVILETLINKSPADSDLIGQVKMIRFSILLSTQNPLATTALEQMTQENKSDPGLLNQLSWGVVELSLSGKPVERSLIDAARRSVDIAVNTSPNDAAILDTQAHLALMQGRLNQAIQIQSKAVLQANREIKSDLENFLEYLQSRKEKEGNEQDND